VYRVVRGIGLCIAVMLWVYVGFLKVFIHSHSSGGGCGRDVCVVSMVFFLGSIMLFVSVYVLLYRVVVRMCSGSLFCLFGVGWYGCRVFRFGVE